MYTDIRCINDRSPRAASIIPLPVADSAALLPLPQKHHQIANPSADMRDNAMFAFQLSLICDKNLATEKQSLSFKITQNSRNGTNRFGKVSPTSQSTATTTTTTRTPMPILGLQEAFHLRPKKMTTKQSSSQPDFCNDSDQSTHAACELLGITEICFCISICVGADDWCEIEESTESPF